MNRIGISLGLLSLGLTLSLPAHATSASLTQHGTECVAGTGNPGINFISYGQYGIYNPDSTYTVSIFCPIKAETGLAGATAIGRVDLIVYDRNASSDIPVVLYLTDINGNAQWSQAKTTSSWSMNSYLLSWFPPANLPATNYAFLSAFLPPRGVNGIESWVSTYMTTITR
jgi:hypothetical protein